MPEEPRKKAGCGTIFGFIVLGFLLLVGLLGGCTAWQLSRFTATGPITLPAFKADPARQEDLKARSAAFQQEVRAGRRAELRIDADDLNTAVALDPQYKELRGRVWFTIEKDVLSARLSFPLSKVPLLKHRWLNATAGLALNLRNGNPNLVLSRVEVNGMRMPEKYLKSFTDGLERGFLESLRKDPNVRDAFKRLHRIEVEGDHVVIEALPSLAPVLGIVTPSPPAPSAPASPAAPQAPSPPAVVASPPTTNAPPITGPDRYLGMRLEDVKRELGPPGLTTEQGESVVLQYPRFTLHSSDGKTVTRVEIGD